MQELPKGWGVLYSSYLGEGKVLGKVRLNKFLARLQRDGFPIENVFINAELGPYDEKIDIEALELERKGLLQIEEHPKPDAKHDRCDFYLTDIGQAYVEQKILPKLERHPFNRFLKECSELVVKEYTNREIEDIIETTHNELYLSNFSKFLEELNKTRNALSDEFKQLEKEFQGFCYISLILLGATEFAIRALDEIQREKWEQPTTGKNNVLYNSKELLKAVQSFREVNRLPLKDCSHSKKCLIGRRCLSKQIAYSKYKLHCIEWSSKVYDILEPFDEEQDLIDYMTEEEIRLFTSTSQIPVPTALR